MKTLTEIKNTYAIEQGYEDWEQLDMLSGREEITKHIDEICIHAQKAALEKAAENIKYKMKDNIHELSMIDDWSEIDRTSITNPENLIR